MDFRWLQYQWNVNRALERRQVIPATIDPDYIKHCYNTGTSPIVCAMHAHNHPRPLRINGALVNPGLCPRCQSQNVMVDIEGMHSSRPMAAVIISIVVICCGGPILLVSIVTIAPIIIALVLLLGIPLLIMASSLNKSAKAKQKDSGVRTCLQCGHKWRAF